ncbi:plasmid pRiA4b ORF-3 family protein [Cereibacter sediminicola]|uniref:plasmid pRiA4b ORF-3 family protein n=1 Tax=Cereibacter sediminicola TaxID=2584941 RepID=UPI001FE6E6BF|nr:plasmid pRiA4b ORF-3 family protein [Cereibacter sediminicola]
MPLKIRLNRLHEVIQAAVGWSDTHLYEFRAGGAGWGVVDPDGFHDGPLPSSKPACSTSSRMSARRRSTTSTTSATTGTM